ncbi:MAG: hypothetical protein AB7N91_04600 [Candidatus Tectimicrobiota bacterium]
MPGVRALQHNSLGHLLLGVVLSLTLVAGLLAVPIPTWGAPSSVANADPALWQEVPFDAQMFLHMQPGWYRVQHSSIYFVIYPDMPAMARGLDRVAYFVEKSATRGIIVHKDRIQDNAFYGHDYSLEDLARFFNDLRRKRLRHDIFAEERALRERLVAQRLLVADKRGHYTGTPHTALLGFAQAAAYPANTLPRPRDIYIHEMFHGIWFTTTYRQDVAAYWQRLPAHEQQAIIDILYQRAQYDPRNLPLIQREFASYFRDYHPQGVLSSPLAQELGLAKLEEYQRELRSIEQPYMHLLGGAPAR